MSRVEDFMLAPAFPIKIEDDNGVLMTIDPGISILQLVSAIRLGQSGPIPPLNKDTESKSNRYTTIVKESIELLNEVKKFERSVKG